MNTPLCMRTTLTRSLALGLLLAGLPAGYGESPTSATLLPAREEVDRAVAKVYPAIVRIEVISEVGAGGRMTKTRASGSGTILSEDGYVLTNHHVAGKAVRVLCRLANREELEAALIGTDPMTDLAVLKLDLSNRPETTPLPVARFGNSDQLEVGDPVMAMGSPAGLSQSVTLGIVSNTEMIYPHQGGFRLDGEWVGRLVRWIGHDAIIYPGNSGGPLVNLQGEIVGINEVGIGSLGGAIPGNLAREVAETLIRNGAVKRSWAGIEAQPLLKSQAGQRGVLVAGVIADSPAAQAGLQPGDVINRFGDQDIHCATPEELPAFHIALLSIPPGSALALAGQRSGAAMQWILHTETREPAQAPEVEFKSWGITARNQTLMTRLEMKQEELAGVLVHSVRKSGPAGKAKPSLAPGDILTAVDHQPVSSLASLVKLTRALTRDRTEPLAVLVAFDRHTMQYYTVVEIGPEPPRDDPVQAEKAWLGITTQVITPELSKAMGLTNGKGLRITKVFQASAAERANLQAGDIITHLDGQAIRINREEDSEVFQNMVRQYPVGANVVLTILRDGQAAELSAVLDARPVPSNELPEYKDTQFEFTAREASFMDRVWGQLDPETDRVVIEDVELAGWAALAGLAQGDLVLSVDGKAVDSIDTLEKIMHEILPDQPRHVVCFVKRGIHTLYVELEPAWEPETREPSHE